MKYESICISMLYELDTKWAKELPYSFPTKIQKNEEIHTLPTCYPGIHQGQVHCTKNYVCFRPGHTDQQQPHHTTNSNNNTNTQPTTDYLSNTNSFNRHSLFHSQILSTLQYVLNFILYHFGYNSLFCTYKYNKVMWLMSKS